MDIPNRPMGSLSERPTASSRPRSACLSSSAAAAVVYEAMQPTPQQRWPLLDARCGTAVWVKHENQTPVGAFKVRGGLVYFDALLRTPSRRQGRRRGDARQSRPVHRVCRGALRHPGGPGRPARQQRGQEPRHACARGRAHRARATTSRRRSRRPPASPPNVDGTSSRRFIRSSCAAWRRTRWSSCAPRRTSTRSTCRSGWGPGSAARWRRAMRSA